MSDMPTLISVVMPAYNCGRYIKDAVTSLLSQTHVAFELLIMDDCSTDNTVDEVSGITDERIRLVKSEVNRGQAFQLNKGIELAKSEFIAIAHADDINMPERLERQLQYLLQFPQIGVVGTEMNYFYENGEEKILKMPLTPEMVTGDLLFYCTLNHPSIMLRKSLLLQHGEWYRQEYVPCEDYDLWCRLVSHAVPVGNIDYVGVKYRMHSNQISKTKASVAENIDLSIQQQLFRDIFSFLPAGDINKFKPLFFIKGTTLISFSFVRYINQVKLQLQNGQSVTIKLLQKWLTERMRMAVLSSSSYSFGAGVYYLLTNPTQMMKLGLRNSLAIIYRSFH